jgi:hypothetical protein
MSTKNHKALKEWRKEIKNTFRLLEHLSADGRSRCLKIEMQW